MEINVDEGVIMQKINFYTGMAVVSIVFIPKNLSAQCVSPIQDCHSLGYTQSSCPNGKGVKCPFGSGWYCGGTAAQDCIKLGYDKDCTGAGESGNGETCNGKYQSCTCDSSYQYTCSGTGYSGGYGAACGGKYTACTCAAGYEWRNGVCEQQILNGPQGDLYYCNGNVVGVKSGDMNFYVAMKDLGYLNWTKANQQCSSYIFCNNAQGTLPTKDQLVTIYNNKSQVNILLTSNGGTQLTNNWYWSSTKYSDYDYYIVHMSSGTVSYYNYNYYERYVRPILTSW